MGQEVFAGPIIGIINSYKKFTAPNNEVKMEAIFTREILIDKKICRAISVIVFIILTALGAFVRIPLPFTPVPITLQTFFVLMSGALLGWRLGGISQAAYIILGITGLPVFTGTGSGSAYLGGPTAGYLFGFILAAVFLGNFIKYVANRPLFVFFLFCLADFILLFCGTIWLRVIFGSGLYKLIFIGFLPFIPGDLLKAALATFLFTRLKSRIAQIL